MANKILIVGNPNTGKTTLFNSITGANEKTANYSGVTVKEKERCVEYNGKNLEFVDLPGVYSLSSTSDDELVTKSYLKNNKGSPVLFVCSSDEIKKNMILLSELANNGHRLMVLINKIGAKIDADKLDKISKELKVPILQADVRKDKNELLEWISSSIATTITKNIDVSKLIKLLPDTPEKLKILDKVLLHNFWGKIIFCVIFVTVLVISYGSIGSGISLWLEGHLSIVSNYVVNFLNNVNLVWLADFWLKVIIGGVCEVIIYLPQLALMLTLLFLLEEVGYLPRVASLFNYRLEKFGMNGKSVFSLIMGIGCTTSAILTTRNIGSGNARRATAKFLPFIGCSAKLPILLFITQIVMGGRGVVYVGLIYLAAIIIGSVYLSITRSKDGNEGYFISEIPKLKIPSLKNSIKQALIIVYDLFKKIIFSVLLSTTILWLMLNITPDFKFFTGEKSLLEKFAEFIAYIFVPLGLNRSDVVISLFSGMIAKENIMSTMGLFGNLSTLSTIQAITFLIFVMLYVPCIPSIKCARCEFGKKFAMQMTLSQLAIAYISAFVFSTFANISLVLGFVILIISSLLLMLSVRIVKEKFGKNAKVVVNPV